MARKGLKKWQNTWNWHKHTKQSKIKYGAKEYHWKHADYRISYKQDQYRRGVLTNTWVENGVQSTPGVV